MDYSSAFVCVMGMGTVFFGLVCLIGLTKLMSVICCKGKNGPCRLPEPTGPAARNPSDRRW